MRGLSLSVLALGVLLPVACSQVTREFNEGAGASSSSSTGTNGGGGSSSVSTSNGGSTSTGGSGVGGTGGDVASSSTGMPQATDIYVDPVNGDDTANDGSQASPLKTASRAFLKIKTGHTVFLAAGNYGNTDNGETFTIPVPAGVAIVGVADATFFRWQGTGGNNNSIGLQLFGSADVTNLDLQGFYTGIKSSTGTLLTHHVSIEPDSDPSIGNTTGLRLTNNVQATLNDLTISGGAYGIDAEDNAVVDIETGDISASGPACVGSYGAIFARGSAQVTATDVNIHDLLASYGVTINESASVTLNGGQIQSFVVGQCGASGVYMTDTTKLVVDGTTIENLGNGTGVTAFSSGAGVEISISNSAIQGVLDDVYGTGPGTITLTNTNLQADNYMISVEGPSLDVESCQFNSAQGTSADIYLDMSSSLRLRGSSLLEPAGNAIWINGDYGAIDLGTSGDPGGNSFSQGQTVLLLVQAVDDGDIHASGNNWIPNDSGADASGHYAVGTSKCGPFNPTPGENIQLNSTQCVLF